MKKAVLPLDPWEQHPWVLYPSICHYTDFGVAQEILQTNVIRSTWYSQLNDGTELIYAKRYIAEAVYEKLTYRYKKEIYSLDEVQEKLVDILYPGIENTFITSFCALNSRLKENDGFLSMWRSYTSGCGCFLEFHTESFFNEIEGNHNFDEVFYGTGKQVREDLDEKLSKYLEEISSVIDSAIHAPEVQRILSPFFKLVTMLKNPGFHEENEIRLAVLNNLSMQIQTTFNVMKDERNRDYIELPFLPKTIRRVVVGPNEDQQDRIRQMKDFLRKIPQYQHVVVEGSSIPYRATR